MPETHAIVIGGSIAGMCAASVLSGFFDKVTVLERDALPEDASPLTASASPRLASRPGVPQARHVHILLERGWIELERLFPGFQGELRAAGAVIMDPAMDTAIRRPTGWQRRMRSGITCAFASRDRTESTIRALLRERPRVTIRDRMDVTGLLLAHAARPRAIGVRARHRDGGAQDEIAADLVVDATGRASRAPAWLVEAGVAAPAETVVDSFAGYSSRWYQWPSADRGTRERGVPTHVDHRPGGWWWKALWIDPISPEHRFGAVLFPIEGDRFIVTLYGHAKHYPPSDEEGFTRVLGALPSPAVAEAAASAEPLSGIHCSRAFANRFRHYERLRARIERFLVLGDSACTFNPIHGQGMTTAALCACALEEALRAVGPGGEDLARTFFDAQARALQVPWALATGADFRFRETVGRRPLGAAAGIAFGDLMVDCSLEDEEIVRRAWPVFHMTRPSKDLSAPDFLARVLFLSLRRSLRRLARLEEAPGAMPPES